MTISSLKTAVVNMTPAPWIRGPAAHQIDGPGGLQVACTTSWKCGDDAIGIVALRNHADALIRCAELLRTARHLMAQSQEQDIDTMDQIDAALVEVEKPGVCTYGKPQILVERHYPHGGSIGAMEPVKVKLPQRYEDSDGNLCLPYAGVVAALKAAGIEVEPC
jgi:hypothetical protein